MVSAAEIAGTSAPIAPGDLVRPGWRRLRFWVALLVAVIVGAVLVGTLSDAPGRPLDPSSPHQDGSLALARLLSGYKTSVTRAGAVNDAVAAGRSATILITAPDNYSAGQLVDLRRAARRIVLLAPGIAALRAIAPGVRRTADGAVSRSPDCSDAGAQAAGEVDLPADAATYEGTGGPTVSCYGGVLVSMPGLVVLGSPDLLRNDKLGDTGVAALDINAISADRSVRNVVWLLPGTDAAGSGSASIWDLFPAGAYRAFWWLIVLGALVVLWRARRLGAVVSEPLPVIVRSAEAVEGHGRLYLRARAADRGAAALRRAATARLAARLGLPRGTGPDQVAVAIAPIVRRAPAEVLTTLTGPPPADDAAFMRLASELDQLEATAGSAAGGATTEGR